MLISSRMAELGLTEDRSDAVCAAILGDLKDCLAIEVKISDAVLFQLVDRALMAYVDTCGSKCFIKDPKLCKPDTVKPLANPISIVMGKGKTMATHLGMLEFVLPDGHSSTKRHVILLPTLICPDFDTDIVILSGPMLNELGIGIGPRTN